MSIKPSAAVAFLVCAIALVPAGASGAPAVEDRLLFVNFLGSGGRGDTGWVTDITVDSAEPIASVTLTAPSTYPVTLNHAPGTRLGFLQARLSALEGGSAVWAGGDLVVASLTRYASDATAQTCAPGAHAAVWRANVAAPAPEKGDPRRSFELPIFVHRVAPDAGLVLRFCPIWRTPGGDMLVRYLDFSVEGVFGRLRTRGWNTWRALVSPPLPTLGADEARTFELRAHEPIPQQVTVTARHDPSSGTVVVSGRATAVGEPQSGVKLTIWASREWDQKVPAIGAVTTDAAGEYSFRYRERQSTQYLVTAAFVQPRACSGPSAAPAGCASETFAPPPPGGAPGVRIRRPSEARVVIRSRDQDLADRIGLKLADLPRGWKKWSFFSEQQCRAFKPDLRRLTVTGWSESGRFVRVEDTASSRVTVYSSEEQARAAFDREASLRAAQCLADELRRGGLLGGARPVEPPVVGDERRAFRIALRGWAGPGRGGRRTVDLLSFRRGRVVVHLGFEGVPARVQRAIAGKLAARARRG